MPTTKMYLYDQKRIIEEQNKGILDEWKTISFNNFHDSILDQSKPFPCYFAVDSEKHGWSRYIFMIFSHILKYYSQQYLRFHLYFL